jgi:hypothetical protein
MKSLRLLELWDDPTDIAADNGSKFYRLATVTWSKPIEWKPTQSSFPVPEGWAGHGGVYAFIRDHGNQADGKRILYLGKAKSFKKRLTNRHGKFNLVKKRGKTYVSCGRIAFKRIKSRPGYYDQIEDIIKFAIYEHLENWQGFQSLPGFRKSQSRAMIPWVIVNEGYRFRGKMPHRIVYPSIALHL